ncbi:MAG: carboxylating nicotinate-nucleotide diphosphorylase [Gammaproteobacteria bacterium]|nr:carboxylating nicotinate-nucleotide diphosphorylase [Gammaproteobacteria bacterium]
MTTKNHPFSNTLGYIPTVEADVRLALQEDIGSGDLTAALVPENQQAKATVITREDTILCGRPWFDEVFSQLDASVKVEWLVEEGGRVSADEKLCIITGPARSILSGERSALNFLQFLSAVASLAGEYAKAVAHTNAKILDTRKTIPGLRLAQKYAVIVGGAANHRVGLYDAILIKENHIVAAGSITDAVAIAREQSAGFMCEVEVEDLAEAEQAMLAEADRLLLDNFSNSQLKDAVTLRNDIAPTVSLEASGGINLKSVGAIAECGVDFISVGSLTKDIQAVDLSMRFKLFEEE